MTQTTDGAPKLPPGPQGRRLRNLRGRTANFDEFLEELYRTYGDVVSFEIPFLKCCAVFDVDLIREVLDVQEPDFAAHMPGAADNEFFKHGFLNIHQGCEHRRRRRLFDTAFSEDRIAGYSLIILREARAFRERCRPGQTIDIFEEIENYMWASLVGLFLGRDVHIERKYQQMMLAPAKLAVLLDILPFEQLTKKLSPIHVRGARALGIVDDAIYGAIERARNPENDGEDVVSHFVRAADQGIVDWTYEDGQALRDDVLASIGMYQDNPTGAMAVGIHHVARHPEVRDRLEREIDEVLGDRPLEVEDYDRLPYTRAVFDETVRLDAPAYAGLGKQATKDNVVGGYLIPKGTVVYAGIGVVHRREDYWDDARVFKPERWLDVSESDRSRYSKVYMPFGIGPHTCPAADLSSRLFVYGMASIVQRLRLEPKSLRPLRKQNIGVGAKGPFRVAVGERKPAPR